MEADTTLSPYTRCLIRFRPDFLTLTRYDERMNSELPNGVGPHEELELELMLAGKKPLAMFNDDIPFDMEPPEIGFDLHVDEGKFVKGEIVVPLSNATRNSLRYYFYALPDEAWRIARLIEIQRGFFEKGVRTTPELETEIGQLLGYEDADILAFIDVFFESAG